MSYNEMNHFINLKNTSGRKCVCGCRSWLKHWERYAGQPAGQCAHVGCANSAEVGAHVKEKGRNDNFWYIIPLCKKHNNWHLDDLDLDGRRVLVPVRPDDLV